MKRMIGAVVGTIALVGSAIPAQAQPHQTKVIAQMGCMQAGVMVMYPEYYGETRSGMDIWICVETGSLRNSFVMMNPGPYPVLACSIMQCRVIDMTY